MATVFKRSSKQGAPYYASFYEVLPSGELKRRIVSTKTPEHSQAKQIAAKLASDAAIRRHGFVDVQAEHFHKCKKLAISELLPVFESSLKTKSGVSKNAKQKLNYLKSFSDHSKITTIGKINADVVHEFKRHLLDVQKQSARTVQYNLHAIKHFTKWLVSTGRLQVDPLLSVESPNPKSDRRKERRMLTPDEWNWLVRGTVQAGFHSNMDATARILLYRLAIQTGLRSSELRSLNRGHFHLTDGQPYVRLRSDSTKNAQTAIQYIDQGLAEDLRVYLSTKTPQALAFSMPCATKVAAMVQRDLTAGRAIWVKDTTDAEVRAKREQSDFLSVQNEAGQKFDFHCLRHTCGAWLALRGVQPKIIQSVMRHSAITLTLDTYGHLLKGSEAAAITQSAALTAMPVLATGTDGQPTCFRIATSEGAWAVLDAAKPCETGQADCDDAPVQNLQDSQVNCENLRILAKPYKAEGTGFEPATGKPATDFESAP
jgi:integrase